MYLKNWFKRVWAVINNTVIKDLINKKNLFFYFVSLDKKNIIWFFLILFVVFFYLLFYFVPLIVVIVLLNLLFIGVLKLFKVNLVYNYYNIFKKLEPSWKYLWLNILYVYLIRQPFLYGYLITYTILYSLINKHVKKVDLEKIIFIFYRSVFKYTLGVPYIVLDKTFELIKKLIQINKFNYKDKSAYIFTILSNLVIMYSGDVALLKDLKIILKKNEPIQFNPGKIDFFSSSEQKLKLCLYDLVLAKKTILKECSLFFGKESINQEYGRFYFTWNTINNPKYDLLILGVTKHKEMTVYLQRLGFDTSEKKLYGFNIYRTKLLKDALLEGKIKQATEDINVQEKWNYLVALKYGDSKNFIIEKPKWCDNYIDMNNLKDEEILDGIVTSLIGNSIRPVSEQIENKIVYKKESKIFLDEFENKQKVFENDELNNYFKKLYVVYQEFINQFSPGEITDKPDLGLKLKFHEIITKSLKDLPKFKKEMDECLIFEDTNVPQKIETEKAELNVTKKIKTETGGKINMLDND